MPRLPRPARALAALALLVAGGCSDAATGPAPGAGDGAGAAPTATGAHNQDVVRVRACDGPATSLPAALAGQLPTGGDAAARGTIDDHLAALARRVPGGFAGVFYDQGRPVLLLTDPSRAADAKAALASELPGFEIAAAEARAARWTFAQLYDWYGYLRRRGVWGAAAVTLTDIDERANRLYLGAADRAERDRLADWLAALELPCDLVRVGVDPPARAL